jgi:hypothetical protein
MMNSDFNRNKEIDHSLAIGAKAFAVGAVLILVLTLTNAPNYVAADLAVSTAGVAAVHDDAPAAKPAGAPAAANDTPPTHIDVPFTSNAADATELPPQF